MKKALLVITTLLVVSCGKDEFNLHTEDAKVENEAPAILEEPETKTGVFNYSGRIPDNTNKIPICKEKEPTYVHFDLVDSKGNLWQRESPVTESDGLWLSEPDSLPYGKYTVSSTRLMSAESDTLYALPDGSDTDFHIFADTILPIELEIGETPNEITGTAMCFTPSPEPDEGELFPSIDFKEFQTLYLYTTATTDGEDGEFVFNCINWIHIWIDGELIYERFIIEEHTKYETLIPKDYETLDIYAFENDSFFDSPVQEFHFTKEDPYDAETDGAIIFDECPE